MPPALLITRPEPAASRMAETLRSEMGDVRVIVSPLMRIVYQGDLPVLNDENVLIFTSRHGVEGFCRLTLRRDLRAYAVGEATAEAARAHGFEVRAADGDAAALLALIASDELEGPFLHPRGLHVAANIAETLRARGCAASETVVYAQQTLPLSPEAREALASTAPVILPLMSPRSGQLFFAAAGAIQAPLYVAAISPNTGGTIPQGVASRVEVAASSDAAAMYAVLRDLAQHAKRVEGKGGAQ